MHTYEYYKSKAEQHYKLAGRARADRATKDELAHLARAKQFDQLARDAQARDDNAPAWPR